MFAITKFRYIKIFFPYILQWKLHLTKDQGTDKICVTRFFFTYFTIIGVKKIVRYIEDFVI